jgi:hypothetical protein
VNLQNDHQCVLCSGCEDDSDFDYCRACGFTKHLKPSIASLEKMMDNGMSPSIEPDGNISLPDSDLIDVAVKLVAFVKSHEYPKEFSPEQNELTMLLDNLETVLRKRKIITGNFPKETPDEH